MTNPSGPIRESCIIAGSFFNEPMRVEAVRAGGDGTWIIGLVGTQSERFRKVTLTAPDLQGLTIFDSGFTTKTFLVEGTQGQRQLSGNNWRYGKYKTSERN